jgi:hypothetical protein
LSVYKNKFVQRTGNIGIFENYLRITGKDPETATFSDFVTDFIGRPFQDLDVHVRPQCDSLLPTLYSDAIPLNCVHARMTEIVGSKLADRFFLPQVNSTSDAGLYHLDSAYLVPSRELRRIYQEKNEFPDKKSFLSAEIRQKLGELYARDFELFSRVSDGVQI